jgi:hypothetical protein
MRAERAREGAREGHLPMSTIFLLKHGFLHMLMTSDPCEKQKDSGSWGGFRDHSNHSSAFSVNF